ncbi:MAG: hypothetical protein ACRD34_10415 [Bryobacteraceae bacterium]
MAAATGGTCNTFQQSVNANNQFVSGYQYDADGNVTYDGVHTGYYDAEDRLAQADGRVPRARILKLWVPVDKNEGVVIDKNEGVVKRHLFAAVPFSIA